MNTVYRFRLANVPAAKRISSGELLTVQFPDSDGLGPDLHPLPGSRFESGDPGLGNPVFGPISVDGAEPGDALQVEFLSIDPDRTVARTLLAPDHGFLPDAVLRNGAPVPLPEKPRHMYLWEIQDAKARVTNPLGNKAVSIPIRPFLGCVGTVSPGAPLSTLLAGSHGGNIDHSDLTKGTSLCLPVSCPGGLLYLGDMHAAQGHGETAGGGLEISGSATIRITLRKSLALRTPRYQTPEGHACLAVGPDIPSAMRQSLAAMTHWITSAGWNICDANMLASQTCEFRFGGIGEKYAVVSCFIAKDQLAGDPLSWGY